MRRWVKTPRDRHSPYALSGYSNCLCLATSHRTTVWSSAPDASSAPSGENATAWTQPVCPRVVGRLHVEESATSKSFVTDWPIPVGSDGGDRQSRTVLSRVPDASSAPSGENATGPIPPFKVFSLLPVATFHRPTTAVRSPLPDASSAPLGENATAWTQPVGLRVASLFRLATFHRTTVLSPAPDASMVPSGENATAWTHFVCLRVASLFRLATFHRTHGVIEGPQTRAWFHRVKTPRRGPTLYALGWPAFSDLRHSTGPRCYRRPQTRAWFHRVKTLRHGSYSYGL